MEWLFQKCIIIWQHQQVERVSMTLHFKWQSNPSNVPSEDNWIDTIHRESECQRFSFFKLEFYD